MRSIYRLAITAQLLALLAVSTHAHSAEAACTKQPDGEPLAAAWVLSASADDVCVYTHVLENSDIREVRVEATLAASPANIFSVISDYAHYPDFMPYVETSEVVKVVDDTNWVFQQLALPFPASDRFYTIRLLADKHLANEGIFRVGWTLAGSDVPERNGRGVRLLTNTGYWNLQPIDHGRSTHVTYFIHTHPGGALPLWMINIANKESAPSIVKAVRTRVAALGVGSTEPSR